MPDPVTEIDRRYSDPDATPTDWAETRAALEAAELSWITTVRTDGRPHVTPLVAVWLDGAAYVATGPEEQKALNLAGNPQVALTTGCNTWDRGLDVVVEGRARRVTDPALLARLAEAWATKWDGQWRFTPGPEGFVHPEGGTAHVFEVRPAKVLAFGKGTPFSHTRHLLPG